MKTQTKVRLLDITDINPQTVSELLEMPEGKKCFRPFYKARASELAEYRADLANKCILMELRLKEKMICVLQSSRRMSSDEVQVSQEYKMLEDEVARNLLAARQIILLIDGYTQKIRTASELKSLEVSDEYPRVEGRVYCEDVSGFEGREYQPILSLEVAVNPIR